MKTVQLFLTDNILKIIFFNYISKLKYKSQQGLEKFRDFIETERCILSTEVYRYM